MSSPASLTQDTTVASRPAAAFPATPQPTMHDTVKTAAQIAVGLTIAVCAIALVVGVSFPAEARRWLAYPFAGIPAQPGEAATIFMHNVRALGAVGGLVLVAQSPYWAGKVEPGAAHWTLQRLGELLLGGGVAANVIVVGTSLGAYGARMVGAVLPHGPIELAAYALALALYLQGRHQPLPPRQILAITALSTMALALAAVLEAFV